MAYVSEKAPTNRLIGIGLVILLHVALVWIMASGLGKTAIEIMKAPIEAAIIEDPTEAPPPPPPPPVIDKLPPPFVPPPEFNITATPSNTNAIASVSREVPTVAPKPRGRGNKQPEYPISAKRLKQQGTVVMLLTVDLDGRVTDAKVETSSGFDVLDDAAVKEALRSWRYVPGMKNGVPAVMVVRAQVRFRCGVNGCG